MEKKIGYLVFLVGVGLVLYALYAANGVLSGTKAPPSIVTITAINLPLGNAQVDLPLPPDMNKMMNIFIYSLSCGFISLTGWLLGLLGVGMVKAGNAAQAKA